MKYTAPTFLLAMFMGMFSGYMHAGEYHAMQGQRNAGSIERDRLLNQGYILREISALASLMHDVVAPVGYGAGLFTGMCHAGFELGWTAMPEALTRLTVRAINQRIADHFQLLQHAQE